MIGNYVTSGLRNFARHKLYSFINITGLAIGLACATFILLFLRDELSYDAWIPDSQDLYRVESTFYMPGRDPDFFSVTPFPVTPTMQQQIPEVVAQTHLIPEYMTAQVGPPVSSSGRCGRSELLSGNQAAIRGRRSGDRHRPARIDRTVTDDGKEILRHD